MTTIGDILDEFFSPLSKERLWIMPENDNYTRIVRQWSPVIDAVTRTKNHLKMNCSTWSSSYMTNPTWKPTKTDAPKPGAYRDFVPSPPGTEPPICKNAFIIYVTSKAVDLVLRGPQPEIQTRNLYTCSIGSFNLYTTVDQIDCTAGTATMDFWMYNNMSRRSFGHFASHPAFHLCGMQSQYMWWNWKEPVKWSSGTPAPSPSPSPNVPKTYIVKSGDNLMKIAKMFYGDPNQWRRIYNANKAVIGLNPDRIYPGQKLIIP